MDLKDQGTNNYTYNQIGEMTADAQEDRGYEYNASGLCTRAYQLSTGHDLATYEYNDKGQRHSKTSYDNTGTAIKTTWYVYDAGGMQVATYEKDLTIAGSPVLKDLEVYAAGRLGIYDEAAAKVMYELNDHLGNTRALVTETSGAAEVLSYTDYYPHGGVMPGQNYVGASAYRYGYQGQEKDPETGLVNFELRQYDPRLGRWYNPDPMGQHHSPYLAMGNNPVMMMDMNGGWDGFGLGLGSGWDMIIMMAGTNNGANGQSNWQSELSSKISDGQNRWDNYWSGQQGGDGLTKSRFDMNMARNPTNYGFLDQAAEVSKGLWAMFKEGMSQIQLEVETRTNGGINLPEVSIEFLKTGDFHDMIQGQLSALDDELIFRDYARRAAKDAWKRGQYSEWFEDKMKENLGNDFDKKSEKAMKPYAEMAADFNPLMNMAHIACGLVTEKNAYDKKMEGSDYAMATIGIFGLGELKGGKNLIGETDDILGHIFRDAPGHVNPGTMTSRGRYIKLFENVANNRGNLVPTANRAAAKAGVQTFKQNYRMGTVWTQVYNGEIRNAGVNYFTP